VSNALAYAAILRGQFVPVLLTTGWFTVLQRGDTQVDEVSLKETPTDWIAKAITIVPGWFDVSCTADEEVNGEEVNGAEVQVSTEVVL
jgi:hypothetical protein